MVLLKLVGRKNSGIPNGRPHLKSYLVRYSKKGQSVSDVEFWLDRNLYHISYIIIPIEA
jgi:hypothetical protein